MNKNEQQRADSPGPRATAAWRQQRIQAALRRDGGVSVTELAGRIGVSSMTIRRDLQALERAGLLVRTHGGAVDSEEPEFDQRRALHGPAKRAIASAAAARIQPREAIGLDIGTTVLALAEALAARADLRLVTSSLRAAMALAESGSAVYLLGGEVRVPEYSVIGASARRQLEETMLDRVFLGVSGISPAGIFDYSPEETAVKQAFVASAQEVVVLCDSQKFDRRAMARIAGLDAIHVLITDARPQGALAEALDAAGIRIILAPRHDHS